MYEYIYIMIYKSGYEDIFTCKSEMFSYLLDLFNFAEK